jgi:hypothetical protein
MKGRFFEIAGRAREPGSSGPAHSKARFIPHATLPQQSNGPFHRRAKSGFDIDRAAD